MKFDCLVIGAGIVGSVIARQLAECGLKVSIIEKREQVAGNLYDKIDSHGIRVQVYGPHIFHTNNSEVWNYINKFSSWIPFDLVCGSKIDGHFVKTSFDLTCIDIFFPEKAKKIKEALLNNYPGLKSVSILELLNSKNPYIHEFAQFLYDKDYAPYTAKQWGIKIEELDPQIFKRVPVLLTDGSRYFLDKYQALPEKGYTLFVKNILDHRNISISTGTDSSKFLKFENGKVLYNNKEVSFPIFYTGPIDQLFSYRFGHLPYRSLHFEWKFLDTESFQPMPVVAYPLEKGYTRITEYKKLPVQRVYGTSIALEFPLQYPANNSEPYYPVLTENSRSLYSRYKDFLCAYENIYCCGRLAEFKYYNMDDAILSALNCVKNFISK